MRNFLFRDKKNMNINGTHESVPEKTQVEIDNAEAKYQFHEDDHPQIMIIEDDQDMSSLLEKFLNKEFGPWSYSFKDEFDALRFASEDYVDLLVIDINLEHINGLELGRMLREVAKSEVPIVYISSDRTYRYDYFQYDQRNTYFMPKPFSQESFNFIARSMLTGSKIV